MRPWHKWIKLATLAAVASLTAMTWAGFATGITPARMVTIAAMWGALAVVGAHSMRRGWL